MSYDDDEELGALIYRSSRTARALMEAEAEAQAEAQAEAGGSRKRKRDRPPPPSASVAVESLPSSPKRARRSRSHEVAAGGTLRRSTRASAKGIPNPAAVESLPSSKRARRSRSHEVAAGGMPRRRTRASAKGTANQVEAKKADAASTRQSDYSVSSTVATSAKASPPKRRRAKYQKHPAIDGSGRRRCAIDGCERPAKAARPYLCREHDSERYQCSIEGCRFRYVRRGLCHRHVEKRFCHVQGCKNQARDKSGACIRHGAKNPAKLCSVSGCSNYRVKSGVCVRHGAMRKKCSRRGCDNMQVNSGVCIRHGAERKYMHCSHKGCRTTVKSKGALCARHSNRYTQSMRNLDTKLRDALDAVEGQSNTDVEAALFGAMMKISTSVDTFEFTSTCAKKFKDAKAKAKFSFRYRRCRLFTTTSGAIICPKAPRDWKRAMDQSKQELRVLLQLVADYLPGEDKNATKVLLRKLIERRKCPSDLVSRLRNVFDAQQGKSLAEVEGDLLTELRKTPNNVNAINICSRWANRYRDTDKSVKFSLICPAFWSGPLGFIIQAKGQNREEAKHQALKEARVLADLFAEYFPQESEGTIKEMLGRLLERRERK